MQTGENHVLKDIELANIQTNAGMLNYFQIVLRFVKAHRLHNLNFHKAPPYPPALPPFGLTLSFHHSKKNGTERADIDENCLLTFCS